MKGKAASLCVALSLFTFSGLAQTYPPPDHPYFQALARICPAKQLENLNPGLAVESILAFPETLTAARANVLRAEAKADHDACEVGSACVNAAYIKAAGRLSMADDLARHVCALPYRCTAPFECQSE
ncbi:hypothetical protein [Ferrovibrio terrae]|uniref:hypothetical protein n=1 Tax=Ferrovibrio terrae TaxID=2594003 RepID=UPI003138264E